MMFFYRNQMPKSEKNQKLSISVLTPPTRPALRRKQETVALRNLSFKFSMTNITLSNKGKVFKHHKELANLA